VIVASPAVFEILGPKHIGVMTWPFRVVMSWVTWPFDSPYAISYSCSFVTERLSPDIFETLDPKHIGVTSVTFQGHVTSTVTW